MLLESMKHGGSSFVTLTYNKENIPDGQTLYPKHTQDWLKRLRLRFPHKIRYYLVGEYGERTQRPHYHAALFGLGPEHSEIIGQTWPHGHTYTGDLTAQSAQYVAGYVTKKMTSKTDPRLNGRHPEFARMSLRPGIGALAINDIANALLSDHGGESLILNNDVPLSLNQGRKKMPLGRYLREKLRVYLGFPENIKKENLEKHKEEMRLLFKDLLNGEELPSNSLFKSEVLKKMLLQENHQKVLNLETKQNIFSKKGII